MTTEPPRRGVSPRRRQDDLLQDLRATVPVPPLPPPSADAPAVDPSPTTDTAPSTATIPPTATVPRSDTGTPAVEVRLTPLRWSLPRATQAADRTGVLLSLGPLQVVLGRRTD